MQKTRMQLAGELAKDASVKKPNSWQTGVTVLKTEGVSGLYKGYVLVICSLYDDLHRWLCTLAGYQAVCGHSSPSHVHHDAHGDFQLPAELLHAE